MRINQSSSLLKIMLLIITLSILPTLFCQPSCLTKRLPPLIPLLETQQSIIHLQQYFTGRNLTFSIEPENNFTSLRKQYYCQKKWEHMIGDIIMAKTYTVSKDVQNIAMLGQSVNQKQIYFLYYHVPLNFNSTYSLHDNQIEVLEVPRGIVKLCSSFTLRANQTHIQMIIDCHSIANKTNKILGFSTINLANRTTSEWNFIESAIYQPPLNQLAAQSVIQLMQIKNYFYLIRMYKGNLGYIELWRWSQGLINKQIVNIYDSSFLLPLITSRSISLISVQISSPSIFLLDYINGIHLITLSSKGTLQYQSLIPLQLYSSMEFSFEQNLLFMGKQGIVQQYEVDIQGNQIQVTRIVRYHLFRFETVDQILFSNRFLYVRTKSFLHVQHLTNVQSNTQQYDGAYNVYPQLYSKQLFITPTGLLKMINFDGNVILTQCETHPPFLYLKSPSNRINFDIKALSVLDGQSQSCFFNVATELAYEKDDNIYSNGNNTENQTLFTNRPGRSIVHLEKFGLGKNLDYDVILVNHQINFTHQIRKTNPFNCQIGAFQYQNQLNVNDQQQGKSNLLDQQSSQQSNIHKIMSTQQNIISESIGSWVIIHFPSTNIKQYYKCSKYKSIQCKLITIYNTGRQQLTSSNQLFIDQQNKEVLLQAAAFVDHFLHKYWVEVFIVTQGNRLNGVKGVCRLDFQDKLENQITDVKIRDDKLYVLLRNSKEIRIYSAVQQRRDSCRFIGSINSSSFPGIYFSPRSFNFNKYSVTSQQTIPSVSSPNTLSTSIDTIFISQFNQILILKLYFQQMNLFKIQNLKNFILDQVGVNVDLIVVLPELLIIDNQVVRHYYLTHQYQPYFRRNYQTNGKVKLVDQTTIATLLKQTNTNNLVVQVYRLNALVSTFKQYAKWTVSRDFLIISFQDQQFDFIQIKFSQKSLAQLVCSSRTLSSVAYLQIQVMKKLSYQPKKQQFYLLVSSKQDSKRQIISLEVASDASTLDKGQNYPYKTYGFTIQDDNEQQTFQIDDRKWFNGNVFTHRYICDDCKNGRVQFQKKINQLQRISLIKGHSPSQLSVRKLQDGHYEFQIVAGSLLNKIKHHQASAWLSQLVDEFKTESNTSYILSQSILLSSTISSSFQSCLTCSHPSHSLFLISLCEFHNDFDNTAILQLKVHSTYGFKSFIIAQETLQVKDLFYLTASTTEHKQLIMIDQLIILRYFDNVFMYVFDGTQLVLFDTVDRMDLNQQHLCWIEVTKRNITHSKHINSQSQSQSTQYIQSSQDVQPQQHYSLLGSLCQTGLYHMVFTINQPFDYRQRKSSKRKSSQNEFISNDCQYSNRLCNKLMSSPQYLPHFRVIVQQTIDLQLQLQLYKIKLPQQSNFLQTICNQTSQYKLTLLTIVQNFNSFLWEITLANNGIAIIRITLQAIVIRYNQYTPTQVTLQQRYFTVLYKSINNQVKNSQFVAVYDKQDYVIRDDFIQHHFFFQAYVTINQTQNITIMQPINADNNEPTIKQVNSDSIKNIQVNSDRIKSISGNNNKKSQLVQLGSQLFVLSKDQIQILHIKNLLKVTIKRSLPSQPPILLSKQPSILYTQSIISFVQTPTQVNSVTIKLFAIDFFQLTGWQIFSIVVASILAVVGIGFLANIARKLYQSRKKLVRLETQILEDQIEHNQIDSTQYRESQITTSDHQLRQSLIQNE